MDETTPVPNTTSSAPNSTPAVHKTTTPVPSSTSAVHETTTPVPSSTPAVHKTTTPVLNTTPPFLNTTPLGHDTAPPVITYCPDDIQQLVTSGAPFTTISWDHPDAVDESGPANLRSSTLPSESLFVEVDGEPLEVVYVFSDQAGNIVECSFTVSAVCKWYLACSWKKMGPSLYWGWGNMGIQVQARGGGGGGHFHCDLYTICNCKNMWKEGYFFLGMCVSRLILYQKTWKIRKKGWKIHMLNMQKG